MISRIEGVLTDLAGSNAMVRLDAGVTLQVMLPAFAAHRLGASLGKPVVLDTLMFLEMPSQGGTIHPRLAGFLNANDRAFFELFVSCKGIGHRKALRAMSLPTAQLALAIADRDAATLQSLPEIGKRTAETIIVTLRDKVEPYTVTGPSDNAEAGDSEQSPSGSSAGAVSPIGREALAVMVELGENRQQALAWIDQVLSQDDAPDSVEDLVAAVYRLRAGR